MVLSVGLLLGRGHPAVHEGRDWPPTRRSEIDMEAGVVVLRGEAHLVGRVDPEPVDVLRQVRRDPGQVQRVDYLPSTCIRDVHGVVEDQQVGEQRGELHVLLLLHRVVARHGAALTGRSTGALWWPSCADG